MGTTVAIDRFRRRARSVEAGAAAPPHPLEGALLGSTERRYGLMTSHDPVRLAEVVATSGDLAVADRLAFLAASQQRRSIVVVALDGWYVACTTDLPLDAAQLAELQLDEAAPRIMSLVTARGITPALGPLVA